MQARIWDLPVRIGHWGLALSVATAWLTAEQESWRLVHIVAGSIAGAIVAFRLVWGFVGSRSARFSAFLRGPSAAWAEIRGHLAKRVSPRASHTVVGGWAALALLGLAFASAASGALSVRFDGYESLAEAHEVVAQLLLAVIGIHLAGVLVMSVLERTNLPRTMLSGRSPGAPDNGIGNHPFAALALLAWTAAAVWALLGWLGIQG